MTAPSWQFTPYAGLLLATAFALLCLLLVLRRYREGPGAGALAVVLAAAGVWDLGLGLELSATELPAKLFWAKLQYPGIVTLPVAWLAFSLRYTGRDRWLSRRNVILASVLPAVTLVLVATNGSHGLIWPETRFFFEDGLWELRLEHGVAFWVIWAYSYAALLAGTAILLSTLFRPSRIYRMQGVALVLGLTAPWVGNALYVFGLSPLGGRDLTPLGFAVGGAFMLWGISRFRLLDIVPIARYAVFDYMNDGVVVLDPRERIVDMNAAARRILGMSKKEMAGLDAGEAMRDMTTVEGSESGCGYREVSHGEGDERREYALEPSEVLDARGERRGDVLLIRDITETRRTQAALRQSEERYRAVVEQAAEGIFLCDVETRRVVESNAAFQRLLGYAAAELAGMRIYDLIDHDPGSVDGNVRLVMELEGTSLGERRYRCKDGSPVDLDVSASLISHDGRESLCVVVRDVTSRKALERRLEHRASHDPLTELPNRSLFMQRLQDELDRHRAGGSRLGLLFLDLDGFKAVNDRYGHDLGDRLLVETASRITNSLRPGDCASRLGGDEFTVLLAEVSGLEEAMAVARRIEERIREPFSLGGRTVRVGVSIGVAASPEASCPDESAWSLMRKADLAMYGVKKNGADGPCADIAGPLAETDFYIGPLEWAAQDGPVNEKSGEWRETRPWKP